MRTALQTSVHSRTFTDPHVLAREPPGDTVEGTLIAHEAVPVGPVGADNQRFPLTARRQRRQSFLSQHVHGASSGNRMDARGGLGRGLRWSGSVALGGSDVPWPARFSSGRARQEAERLALAEPLPLPPRTAQQFRFSETGAAYFSRLEPLAE